MLHVWIRDKVVSFGMSFQIADRGVIYSDSSIECF